MNSFNSDKEMYFGHHIIGWTPYHSVGRFRSKTFHIKIYPGISENDTFMLLSTFLR